MARSRGLQRPCLGKELLHIGNPKCDVIVVSILKFLAVLLECFLPQRTRVICRINDVYRPSNFVRHTLWIFVGKGTTYSLDSTTVIVKVPIRSKDSSASYIGEANDTQFQYSLNSRNDDHEDYGIACYVTGYWTASHGDITAQRDLGG